MNKAGNRVRAIDVCGMPMHLQQPNLIDSIISLICDDDEGVFDWNDVVHRGEDSRTEICTSKNLVG